MLTWFSEDWRATSWGPDIHVVDYEKKAIGRDVYKPATSSNKITLNRFGTVAVLAGERSLETSRSVVLHKEPYGSTSYSYGSCTCSEKEVDKKKETVCEQTTTVTTPYRVTAQDEVCWLAFRAKAGRHYEAFIREDKIMLQNSADQHLETSTCYWGTPYSYETTESSSNTSRCSN